MPAKHVINKARATRLAEAAFEVAEDIQKGRVNLLGGTLCHVINQRFANEYCDDRNIPRIKLKPQCKGPAHCAMGELLSRVLTKNEYRETQGTGDPNQFIFDFLKLNTATFGTQNAEDRISDAAEAVMTSNDQFAKVNNQEGLEKTNFKIPKLPADERSAIAHEMRKFAYEVLAVANGPDNIRVEGRNNRF